MTTNRGGWNRTEGTGRVWATVLLGVAVLVGVAPAYGQGVIVGGRVCPPDQVEGTLGISGLDCVGECSIALTPARTVRFWSFSVEPRIMGIEPGSPADGVLQEGDRLVAVDGILITTREGGRRFADLEPGNQVRISYRRGGAVREALLNVGTECAEPLPRLKTGRVVIATPVQPDEPEPRIAVGIAPRVEVLPGVSPVPSAEPVPDSAAVPLLTRAVGLARVDLLDPRPRGRLGLGFSCSECGTRTDEETGRSTWFFSGPLEVTQVNAGGPAEKAGIRLGDFITAINGTDIATEAGGQAFSTLEPGESVEITVTRRNGREETVSLVPADEESLLLKGGMELALTEPPPEPRRLGAPLRAPRAAETPPEPEAVVAAETGPLAEVFAGPEGLPLTYSGTVEGVEVVVRGGPVSVSELKGARTVVINADGLWIRIRIPGGAPKSGGGGGGSR